MAATVQIVDKVGGSGAVLLDLNRHLGGVMLGRGHEFAEVEQAQARGDQPFAWSPAPVEPGSLRSRQITVPVVLFGGTADATAALVHQLRSLTSSRFILKLQRHGSTVPVWLRCAAGAVQVQSSMTAREHTTLAQGTLTAQTEPYAIGARVDVGPATITQDPASGTPFVWDINSVGGDALTPLVIRCSDFDLTAQIDRILISTRRRGTPSSLTGLVVQGEDATVTLGTSPPTVADLTGDTDMSGSAAARATYGTSASGPWALTATFPDLEGVEAPGMYRLLVRVRRGGAAATDLFSIVATCGATRLVESVTAGGNTTRVVDMGLVQVPTGQPAFLASPESPVEAGPPTVSVAVVRAEAGEGTFDVDWIALVPADQDCGVLEVAAVQSGHVVLDGWDQTPRVTSIDPYSAGAQVVQTNGLTWVGGAPRLRPGSNRLYVVGGLGIASTSVRTPALSLALSGSYWPRYSWLA